MELRIYVPRRLHVGQIVPCELHCMAGR